MEYIKYQQCHTIPQYVFEGSYALRCCDNCIMLDDVVSDYANPLIEHSPFTGASTEIRVLFRPHIGLPCCWNQGHR